MWLGERISEDGIGNGISLIIMIGIIAFLPQALINEVRGVGDNIFIVLLEIGVWVLVTGGVVLVSQGMRRIPVQYAKRVVGRKAYGGSTQYLPLRVNAAGVMPIIFAQSIMFIPSTIASFFPNSPMMQQIGSWFSDISGMGYSLLFFFVVVFRYGFNADLFAYEEWLLIICFWLYFMAAAIGTWEGSHVNADLLDFVILDPAKRRLRTITITVIELVVTLALIYWSILMMIDELGDPLIHMVRNSADHGIESPEDRIIRLPTIVCLTSARDKHTQVNYELSLTPGFSPGNKTIRRKNPKAHLRNQFQWNRRGVLGLGSSPTFGAIPPGQPTSLRF